MSTVMITGGTGMIGTALSRLLLQQGYDVIILSRNPVETASVYKTSYQSNSFRPSGKIYYAKWDIDKMKIDDQALSQADYIVHLAGEGVAKKRWTKKRKEEIAKSRTQSSDLLYQCLSQKPHKVKAVISASAIGWYGPDTGTPFKEEDPYSHDFLGETCHAWESSISKISNLNIRLVVLRLGIALSNEGGALAEFKKPARMGVAGILGTGNQMVSWIHIDDLCRAFLHAIETPSMSGVFNLAAPEPVNNKTLTLGIAQAMNGKLYIPIRVPEFLLKLILGEMSIEVLKSTTVDCSKLQKTEFNFIYPNVRSALKHLIG